MILLFLPKISVKRVFEQRSWFARTSTLGLTLLLLATAGVDAQMIVLDRPEADRIAIQKGWLIRTVTPDGGAIEFKRIVNGIPLYYATTNIDAAESVSTDAVWPGGLGGLDLTGAGVRLGIWDGGGVRRAHQELRTRVAQRDGQSGVITHATHVAGTMIAAGVVPGAQGMSYAASLDAYDFNNDESEMLAAAAAGLRLSNHSYGFITGWEFGNFGAGNGWYWFGDESISKTEDYSFGFYSTQSRSWDGISYGKPHYLIVNSAGNDRNSGPASGAQHYVFINGFWVLSTTVRNRDGNDGYDSISHASLAKNVFSIGAVNDVPGGYAGPSSVIMSSFSGWGPTDEGRIKPDIVANGVSLYSSSGGSNSSYARLSGTSMSSPNTTGSLGLLIEHFRATHDGREMLAATLKGLAIHTADECGSSAGPDYAFGWGLLNTLRAAQHVTYDQIEPGAIQELTLADGQIVAQSWTSGGADPLIVTISWTDPPGTVPPPALDAFVRALVNDLDLRVIGPDDAVYEPWTLDVRHPTEAATKGDNNVDNVEVIRIENPTSGEYAIQVSHKGELVDSLQAFSLFVTGATLGEPVAGACCDGDSCTADLEELDCLDLGGTWYGGTTCASFACPSLGACCSGCAPSAVCEQTTLVECRGADGRWQEGVLCEEISCELPGNDCASDIIVISDGIHEIDTRCSTTDGPSPVTSFLGDIPVGSDVWFSYRATCTGDFIASMCATESAFDSAIAVYHDPDNPTKCPCPTSSITQLGNAADENCNGILDGGAGFIEAAVTEGHCYTIRAMGYAAAQGVGVLEVSCNVQPCFAAPVAMAESPPTSKNQYISFDPGDTDEPTAIRVTIRDMDGFSGFSGKSRWVGAPRAYPEEDSSDPFRFFFGASLQCEPTFTDWSDIDLLHVFGGDIVPDAQYDVQAIGESCASSGIQEEDFSESLLVNTAGWGDVVAPFAGGTSTQPDFSDIASIVDKFLGSPNAPIKARTQIQPNVPDPLRAVDFNDIAADVDAFLGNSYPFAGPCLCPSTVMCGVGDCSSDVDCGDGMCVDGFCADACGRCTP